MKYPSYITKYLKHIEKCILEWPVKVKLEDVINWVLQFQPEDIEIPLRVIDNLNLISFEEVNEALKVAYSKLYRVAISNQIYLSNKNTLFAGLGNAGKSGSMISYHFRVLNDVSENNFIDQSNIPLIKSKQVTNIVLVDDIIASGDTAIKEINRLLESVAVLNPNIKVFLLSVCGMKKALERVNEETAAYAFAAYEYDDEDTVSCLDSSFYNEIPYEKRSLMKEKIIQYGKITNKSGLGYKGIGTLIVFPYNIPNCTLPLIWGDKNGWIPLFRRAGKINGISGVFEELDKTVDDKINEEKEQKESNVNSGELKELNLYVEGKTDEEFFCRMVSNYNLAGRLGYSKIKVIALGGTVFSTRFLENLNALNEEFIVILDNDLKDKKSVEAIKSIGAKKIIYLEPSVIQFIDIKKFFDEEGFEKYSREFERHFKDSDDIKNRIITNSQIDYEDLLNIERVIRRTELKRGLIYFNILFQKYSNTNEIEKFVSKLEEEIKNK